MTSLPADVLAGLTYGTVVGMLSAVVVGTGSFLLWRYDDWEIPHAVVVVAALLVAGAIASVIGVFDPQSVLDGQTGAIPRLVVGGGVAAVLGLYGNSQGRAIAAAIPRRQSMPTGRKRRLSGTVLESVDSAGQVHVAVSSTVQDIDGYPPLSPDVRNAVAGSVWRLPANLPICELEARLADRLQTRYGFAAVRVSIDRRGQATVAAAPPTGSLAHRVRDGQRAVSVDTVVPTGVAQGDTVCIHAGDQCVEGTVLETSVEGDAAGSPDAEVVEPPLTDGSPGGPGTMTVSIGTTAASDLLETAQTTVIVRSTGTNHALAAVSHLERADLVVRHLTVGEETIRRLSENAERVQVLAVRHNDTTTGEGWNLTVADMEAPDRRGSPKTNGDKPKGDDTAASAHVDDLEPNSEAFVVGQEAVLRSVDSGESNPEVVVQ